MKTLKDIFWEKGYDYFPTDKDTTHSYLDLYDSIFSELQSKEISMVEVGISWGGSLRLWENYFPNIDLWGVDVYNGIKMPINTKNIIIKDIKQITPEDFNFTYFDIAVDDGSHILEDQIVFLQKLWPFIKKGGHLLIEDIDNCELAKTEFEKLNIPFYIHDFRNKKNRWDDVIFHFIKN
jgi:hypothetical protein